MKLSLRHINKTSAILTEVISPVLLKLTMMMRVVVTNMTETTMRIQEGMSNIIEMFLMGGSGCGGLDTQTVPSSPTWKVKSMKLARSWL